MALRLAQACTKPERQKPSTKGHSVAQNMSHPLQSDWPISWGATWLMSITGSMGLIT